MTKLPASALAAASLASFAVSSAPAFAQAPPRAPATIAVGDANLTPVVDVRIRGEFREDPPDMGGGDAAAGIASPPVHTALAVLERARLGVGVDGGPLRGRLVLQDARLWGTEAQDGVFGPYEAWLEAHTSSLRPAWLRVGRQAVTWGEGLLLGAAEFSPTGRSLDAVRGQISLGPVDIEALAALLVATQPQTPTFGTTAGRFGSGVELYGLRAAWPVDPLLRFELAGLARIARTGEGGGDLAVARGEGETYVASLRASGDSGGIAYGAEGAYELGRALRGPSGEATRSAWAAFARVGKTFEAAPLSPSVRIGGSYASGDDRGGGAYTAFDPILPDVHVHFGAMNAFAWSNTIQAHVRGGITPFEGADVSVEYRYARLADANGEWVNGYLMSIGQVPNLQSAELGHELDVRLGYTPWPMLDLRAGYAGVRWGDGARTILSAANRGPGDLAHFAYLEARLHLP